MGLILPGGEKAGNTPVNKPDKAQDLIEVTCSCTEAENEQVCNTLQSVQWPSHIRLCDPMDCSTPGFLVYHQLPELLKLMSMESVMPSSHHILYYPLLLLLPLIPPSIRVFSNESFLCIRWPKDWSFSFNISPSNEHPGLISFSMDWLDLLAVQGTQFFSTQLSSQSRSHIHT